MKSWFLPSNQITKLLCFSIAQNYIHMKLFIAALFVITKHEVTQEPAPSEPPSSPTEQGAWGGWGRLQPPRSARCREHTAERRGRPCTRISRVPKRDVRNSNNICVSVQKRSPERAHQKLASGVTAHSLVQASSRVHALHAPSMRQAGTQSGLRARRGTDGGTCRCTCGVPVRAQRVAAPFLILCRRETRLQSVVTGHTALLAHFMASASLS